MDIAERIKTVRGELSQDDFAQKTGVHKSSLGRYERGESIPDLNFLKAICSNFGTSPQWLLFGNAPMRPDEDAPAPQTPSSTPQDTGRIAALEARVALLEERLRLRDEVRKAREETLAAYKQAMDTMRELALMGGQSSIDATMPATGSAPSAHSPSHTSK